MRLLSGPKFDSWRLRTTNVIKIYGSIGNETCGAFKLPTINEEASLLVVATAGVPSVIGDWDHVSVSLPNQCPTWEEMDMVKREFFAPNETAMQLHVPVDEHISFHAFCLHLWRPCWMELPRPPANTVAPTVRRGGKGV